jgi:hypothetical protein
MIQDYVESRYKADYETRLKQQFGREQRILQDDLVAKLCETRDMIMFVELLKTGLGRGNISVIIDRENSPGFVRMHEVLLDTKVPVKRRVAKLYVIYSGLSLSGEPAFDGGNFYRADWKPLHNVLKTLGREEVWDRLQKEMRDRGHVYRGGSECANRHGHSNDNRSFFSFGCMSIKEYHSKVSQDQWNDYLEAHCDCCGVRGFLAQLALTELEIRTL